MEITTHCPNQSAANALVAASDGAIHVRWYRTHGEQFHTKLAVIYGPSRLWLTAGSANLTRRDDAISMLRSLRPEVPQDHAASGAEQLQAPMRELPCVILRPIASEHHK